MTTIESGKKKADGDAAKNDSTTRIGQPTMDRARVLYGIWLFFSPMVELLPGVVFKVSIENTLPQNGPRVKPLPLLTTTHAGYTRPNHPWA